MFLCDFFVLIELKIRDDVVSIILKWECLVKEKELFKNCQQVKRLIKFNFENECFL